MTRRGFVIAGVSAGAFVLLGWTGFIVAQRRAHALPTVDFWAHVDGPRKPWQPVGRMDTSRIPESSGIVASRRYPGIFWTHSDSFNSAAIFAVTEDGTIVARINVSAPNSDWEDIAVDDAGFLYIADVGNNFHFDAHRYIYKIPEPNPHKDAGKTVAPVASYALSYPKKPFDAEAFFVRDGRMYLVSRHDEKRARIYRLDPGARDTVTPTEIAALRAYRANGADVSDDGTSLAVCTTRDTWIYRVNKDMAPVQSARPVIVRYPDDQVEACTFVGNDLILTNEKGQLFRITDDDIRNKVVFVPPSLVPPDAP